MDTLLMLTALGLFLLLEVKGRESSIVVPPWGDPTKNPCASKPNGWQLLYWPPDDECYRIFQKGYPCPESMELTPGKGGIAECQCPPGTAQSPRDAICYKLFHRGPCKINQYFAPVASDPRSYQRHRWGACIEIEPCANGRVYWAKESTCYDQLVQGPCPKGLLLQSNDGFGECACDNSTMQSHYWDQGSACYEHFTQGPCEKGQLFLPGGKCGCDSSLRQYFPENGLCYALDTNGPCKPGNKFSLLDQISETATCVCEDGYTLWEENGHCYRPYTRGPCEEGHMLEMTYNEGGDELLQTSCVLNPCPIGKLYFPGGKGCHKIGTQGPCPDGQIVLYQRGKEKTYESVSYLGVCGCHNHQLNRNVFFPSHSADYGKCSSTKSLDVGENQGNATKSSNSTETMISPQQPSPTSLTTTTTEDPCSRKRGTVLWSDHTCQSLYSQGPCREGEWVVPDRGKGQRKGRGWKIGKCECRPGYTVTTSDNGTVCQSPSVVLAKFLTTNSHSRVDPIES